MNDTKEILVSLLDYLEQYVVDNDLQYSILYYAIKERIMFLIEEIKNE